MGDKSLAEMTKEEVVERCQLAEQKFGELSKLVERQVESIKELTAAAKVMPPIRGAGVIDGLGAHEVRVLAVPGARHKAYGIIGGLAKLGGLYLFGKGVVWGVRKVFFRKALLPHAPEVVAEDVVEMAQEALPDVAEQIAQIALG